MDKLMRYRSVLKQQMTILAELANRCAPEGAETLCVFDDERDCYLVLNVGWAGERRMRGTTLFVRLRAGKFWIEEDWTEQGITADLLLAGVPKEDIVLAFQHPNLRALTEYAVA